MSDEKRSRDVPLRHAAQGAGGPDASPAHHRAVLPVDRSVLWTPIRDPGDPDGPAESGPYELFFARSALRRIGSQTGAEENRSSFGFILGRLYRCPESGVHYAVADEIVPAQEPMSEDAPDPYLLRAWAGTQEAFDRHGGVLVGWYHVHRLLGLILSEGDREMNERYFSRPWQCCLLSVPDPARPMGAIFRPSATPEGGGDVPAPFRELLAVEAMPSAGPLPTALRWKNYVPDREVELERDGDEASEAEVPVVVAPEPPLPDPTSSMTLVLPDNRLEHRYPRLPLRRKSIMWLLVIVAVAVGGYLGGLQLFRSGGEPPPVVTAPVQRPPPVAPEVQQFMDAATELEEAMLGYEERRQDFDLGRIGCELLAGGYAAADDAFVVMAGSYAGLGEAVTDSLSAEYERLTEDTNRLNQHFDASRCPRPE